MTRHWILAGLLSAALGTAAIAATPAYVAAALNDSARPADEKALDAERKPEEMIKFAGIKPGSRVMDLVPGGGYFTHIFAKVVGDKGRACGRRRFQLQLLLRPWRIQNCRIPWWYLIRQ